MKKQLKFYILFILCLVLIPSTVSAHTITFGKQDQSSASNVTKIPVNVITEGELSQGENIKLDCDTNVANVKCEVIFGGSGIGKEGVVASTIASGVEQKIAELVITNSANSNSSGTATVTGRIGGSSVNKPTSFNVGSKPALRSNPNFTGLKTSQGKIYPEFKSDTYEYTIYDVKDTIKSLTLSFTCEGCGITKGNVSTGIEIQPTSSIVKVDNLVDGNNSVEIKSTSEDGSKTVIYTFTIIRGETAYDSAKLTALTIGDLELSPEFKEDVTEYSVSVPYSTKDLTTLISTTLKDTNAEVEITGADKLVEGENTVTIKVTSVNKDKEVTYTIKVTRLSSDDIILISYANGKITFKDAEGEKKTLTEEEFEKEYPTVWKDIKAKKYKFDEDGNLITDKDKKEEKKKDNKGLIIAIIAIIAVIIIGASGYFLFRKKDPEKEAKKKEEKIKKKAEKKARKDRLKKMEEEYYNEYYGEDDEYEDEYEDEEESDVDKKEETEDSEEVDEVEDKEEKNKKVDKGSLVDDDYLFESSLVEEENEEDAEEDTRSKRHKDDVVDIDSALEDLMNTKTYDFSDELKDVRDINEDEDEDE